MRSELHSDYSPIGSFSSDHIDITGDDEVDIIRVYSVLFGNANQLMGDNVELEQVKGHDADFGQGIGNGVKLGLVEGGNFEEVGPSDQYKTQDRYDQN
ncbi:hypothetical protein ACJIZ3_008974 [Penstemon smallii]|uniref:Uncharacterized protein n=1 Tax=Penstemon smallii TaxID=265156 RepID=A0ABD3TCX8_9LAMI